MKDELLAVLAHELRTRLNAMLGWLQLLRNNSLDVEQSEHAIEVVHRNADAQVRLIDEALDASRIVSGAMEIVREPVRPGAILDAAVESLAAEARRKHIVLEKEIPPDLPAILGDGQRVQQIVGNALANAVKFTPNGGHVRVRAAKGRGTVRIEVRDDGVGIAPAMLPRVFDGFRLAEGGTMPERGGLGLGLAIARHLVKAHRGSIRLASGGSGRGTTVTITLPAARGAADIVEVGRPDVASLPILKEVTALLVDDHEDSSEILAALLERRGAQVLVASDAGSAFETLANSTPDLLIADIAMPGIDGQELIRRVRDGGSTIPAIALSATAHPEDRDRALRAGYDAYCTKPVDANELFRVIASLPGVR
ncbi:MAG TPA: ATP-binding protein [Candidatus Polarisedimenticolia bacterium]|nr:ATP-binding protein [Candidatus Polarisedimenticolia bacterium]